MESSEVYTTNVSVDQAISRVNDVYEIEGLRQVINTPTPVTGSTFILWGSTWHEQTQGTLKAIVATADVNALKTAFNQLGSGTLPTCPDTVAGEDGPQYAVVRIPSTTKLTTLQLEELIADLNTPASFSLGRIDLVTDVGDLEVKQAK